MTERRAVSAGRAVALAAISALSCNAGANAATQSAEIAAARGEALASLAAVEQRPCPAFGDTNYVEGISDTAQLHTARESEMAFVRNGLASLSQMAGDARLSAAGRQQIAALGNWNVVTSFSNWTLLTIAEQALASPAIASGAPFPLTLIDGASTEAARLDLRAMEPDAAAAMQRLRTALAKCAAAGYQAVLAQNEGNFSAEVNGARTMAELDALAARFQLARGGQEPIAREFQSRIDTRRARLAALIKPARTPPAARPQAPAAAYTAEQMETARRFVRAASANNEQAALRELSDDVVMSTPNGTYRGRSQVAAAVREQSSSGKSGSMGEPFGDQRGIAVRGRVSAFGVISRFSFNAANKIRQISVSLN